jgi:predicted alpha/beta hydrolase
VSAAAARAVRFAARDGRTLAGTLLSAGAPRGALLINAATGFAHGFYREFALYCAARGYHTLTYDYRGIAASASAPLSTEHARMSDWGRRDMPAALDYLAAAAPGLPLATLGHSVGGQLIGAMDNESRARAHVMIAASSGYWRYQRLPFRLLALAVWRVYGPLMLASCGYVPRGRLWRGEPLPPGVFRQWRAWCLQPTPFGPALDAEFADDRFATVRTPLLSLAFSDDPIATRAAVDALLAAYPRAPVERRVIRPAEVGARRLGHHGFFFARQGDPLWRGVLDWIDARCA